MIVFHDAISITHLIIDSNHPLASEVQAYQRQRIRKLMLRVAGAEACGKEKARLGFREVINP
ncbi:hypothetical protein BZZ01_16675 [Nostocales cyanobacterium HT-58-2]|nr:hypothetical protein BZZ01_16675 [Nostocales cyanobacterium HT-58-2]